MDTRSAAEPTATRIARRSSGRRSSELVVTRTIDGPPDSVFEAWTDADLFRQWWVPKSLGVTLLSCEVDARVGGGYRLTFDNGAAEPMAFFGRYLEVTPPSRLVWTNEEGDGGHVVTTATFEEDHAPDTVGRPRPLSLEGGAGRRGRVRGDELESRDVRPARRAARQAGHEHASVGVAC